MMPLRPRLRLLILRLAGRTLSRRATTSLPDQRRILLIRPDHIGDVVFMGPALRLLRQSLPHSRIDLLVGPWVRELAERLPGADRVLVMEFPWFNRQPTRLPWIPYVNLLRWAGRLAGRYDTAVVLRFDHWWGAWLAAQAGIAGRIGYDVPEVAPFITRRRGFTHCHAVLQNIDLVEALVDRDVVGHTPQELPLSLELKPEDEEEARRILAHAGLNDSRPLIAIHPGAGASDKLWTPGAWAELADALVELGAAVALTGSATELPLVTQVGEHSRSQPAVLAGRTSLGGLAAVFRRCDVVIGPDTGPLHLAVAVGTPTVHRWGPYDQTIFGPWGPADRHRVVKPSGEDGRDIQALLQGAEACSSRLR